MSNAMLGGVAFGALLSMVFRALQGKSTTDGAVVVLLLIAIVDHWT